MYALESHTRSGQVFGVSPHFAAVTTFHPSTTSTTVNNQTSIGGGPSVLPPWITPPNDLMPLASGTMVFSAILSLSTLMQLKIFRISTGTPPPIPTLFGITSVATAAYCSHLTSIKAFQMCRQDVIMSSNFNLTNRRDIRANFENAHAIDLDGGDISHVLRVCAFGLLAFKGLGGRFWSIAPSNITNLGSFARTIFSIPATEKYASPSQRQMIERLGRTIGCHTCGSRKIFYRGQNGVKFIADHMPPQAVVKQMNARWYRRLFGIKVKQRFYPQCVTCSNLQGGLLSKATQKLVNEKNANKYFTFRGKVVNLSNAGGGKNAYNHGFTFRKEHLAGGAVAAATTLNANERDVLGGESWGGLMQVKQGNRGRFLEWQNKAERAIHTVVDTCKRYIAFR